MALDAIGAEGAERVLGRVVAMAEQGDMAAARIVLDRCWPIRRGRPARFPLPPLESLADVPRATAAIAAAVAAGELTSDEAAGLAGVLAAHVRPGRGLRPWPAATNQPEFGHGIGAAICISWRWSSW